MATVVPPGLPTSIGSKASPTGQELPLYNYGQLMMVNKETLKSRARFLQGILGLPEVAGLVPPEMANSLRTNAEAETVIRWILDVQVLLLAVLSNKPAKFTVFDYGLPSNGAVEQQIYENNLPSIKKSHASILATSPKKGPTMHDTPPSQQS